MHGGGELAFDVRGRRSLARVVVCERALVALAPKLNTRRHKVKIKINLKVKIKINLKVKIGVVAKAEHQFEGTPLRWKSLCRPQVAPIRVHAACQHGAHVRDAARIDHGCPRPKCGR